jgi:HPr kinase/phosphorylase
VSAAPAGATAPASLHATCVVVDEVGVLITGDAGSGKSTLARALLDRGARLVGDDRVRLAACHGRLVARGHPAISGLIEVRGLGPVRAPRCAEAAVVRLLVALAPGAPRMPEHAHDTLLGVVLPRLALAGGPGRASAVLWRARAIRDMLVTP